MVTRFRSHVLSGSSRSTLRKPRVVWSERGVAHIARHEVTPQEVEDVLFSPLLDARRGKREGAYLVFGRSRADGGLLIVIAPRPGDSWYVVTARDVDKAERRRMKR